VLSPKTVKTAENGGNGRRRGGAGSPLNGGIAQLGERLLCKQEVVGSIPSASTITSRIWLRGIEHEAPVAPSSFFDIVHRKRSEV
jgi:hypothetical protein